MKKILILLFVSTFIISANAQNLSVPHYGIKAGYNHSSFNFIQYNYLFGGSVQPTEGYPKPSQIANSGIKAGFFVDIKLSKNWHISPTLSYSQFGSYTKLDQQWDNTYIGDTIRTYGFKEETFKMDYITLEPLFEYRPILKLRNGNEWDKLTLIVGPSVSYLISNNLVRYVEEENTERSNDAYNGEIPGVSDIDAGINLGMSVFLTEHFDVDLNLYIGMLGFEDIDEGYQRTLKAFSVSCGYTFN